jgi:hypothetical protein
MNFKNMAKGKRFVQIASCYEPETAIVLFVFGPRSRPAVQGSIDESNTLS